MYGSNNYEVIYDEDIDSEVVGFRQLTRTEKAQINYDYDIWWTNPLMMEWEFDYSWIIGLNPYSNTIEYLNLYASD